MMIERCMASLFLLGSSIYLYQAAELTFGTLQSPRAGFLPVLVGCLGVGLSLRLLVSVLRVQHQDNVVQTDWAKFGFILLGLVFYMVIFQFAGYLISTILFFFYIFKVGNDIEGWVIPLLLAVTSTSFFYLLFHDYLEVLLP